MLINVTKRPSQDCAYCLMPATHFITNSWADSESWKLVNKPIWQLTTEVGYFCS